MKRAEKSKVLYAVVVFLTDGIEIYRTTDRDLMLSKVREVAGARQQYTVLNAVVEA